MIEKVMRAVKSSNKKSGRNITIGAVVGMLLSCTAVMKADDYLWIKNNNGVIEFSTIDNNMEGDWKKGNPYPDNSWNGKIYTNNIALSGTDNGQDKYGDTIGYGLRLTGNLGKNFNLVNNGSIVGSTYNRGFGIYLSDTTMRNIVNSGIISGSDFGVGLLDTTMGDIINTGTISGSNLGVYLYNTTMEDIVNNGIISGSGNYASGVYLYNTTMGDIVNSGIISGSGNSGSGVGLLDTTMGDIINAGIISGSGNSGSGVDLDNTTMGDIENSGIISGTGTNAGSGVYLYNTTMGDIENKGIIYGTTNAIKNEGGTITKAHNYGLLVNGDASGKVVDGLASEFKNYGLIFNAVGDEYTIDDTFGNNFGKKVEKDGYSVINVKVGLISDLSGKKIDNNKIESLKLTDGELSYYDSNEASSTLQKENIDSNKKYVLNGITDTLLVSAGNNRLNNSVINAYGNAVVFDTAGGELTLTGTVVNGGLKDSNSTEETKRTYAIKGSSEADTLILENAVINGNINLGAGANIIEAGEGTNINGNIFAGEGDDTFTLRNNVFINGNINTGGGADTINIENGVQINGTLDGGTDSNKDILNFGVASNIKTTSSNEEIRILHNISGFENININSNVTFYESTIDTAGKIESLKVTGAEEINIGVNGILTLRIDSTKKDTTDGKIIGHALYGAVPTGTSLLSGTGTSISSTGGKLVLALNGAGNDSIINFGTTTLGNSMVGAEDKSIEYQEDFTIDVTSFLHSVERIDGKNNEVRIVAQSNIPLYREIPNYKQLNKIYKGVISVNKLGNFVVNTHENLSTFLSYLNDIYAGNPYSYSSELSRKSAGMFRDIVTENQFKPNLNNWMIYGGLTHVDGGTKDTYYGKGYYTYDIGSSDMEADTKITGAYILGEYGVSETLTSGVIIGGNKLKSELSNGSKVDGDALYLGAYAKKYIGNLKVTAGLGFQYGDYDADRLAVNRVASETGESVTKYTSNYNDMTYDIYLNGRYSNPIGENLFLEPYATLSYTYVDQDGANEGSKTLAIETDSKSFDYTVGKIGLDLKKNISHSNGKSTLTAGVSYTKILDGAEEEHITGRFKGGTDFDILVAHKNQHSIGLNAKYALELESGILFDVKGTYSVERDSHNGSGKNRTKGEWIVGTGLGYKF